MKYLKLYDAYTNKNSRSTVILYEDWGNGYSLGGNSEELKCLTLWFDKDNKQPYIGWFENIDVLYFNGLYESLNGDDIMTYHKVINPLFLKGYLYGDEQKVRYEFRYNSVIDMNRDDFYNEIKYLS